MVVNCGCGALFVGAGSLSMGAGSLFMGTGWSIVGGGACSHGQVVCGYWFVVRGCGGDVLSAVWSSLARWEGTRVGVLTMDESINDDA